MVEMIGTTLPVVLIFLLGIWCRKRNFLLESSMNDIKKFIINIALPCVLIQTFINLEIKLEYLTIIALTFSLLFILMIAGHICNFIPKIYYRYNAYMCTGFSFGLLGMGLFSIIYGEENLAIFSIMGLAHEVFIWSIYYFIFRLDTKKEKFSIHGFLRMLKSPIIVSILLGVACNISGIGTLLYTTAIGEGLQRTMAYLASTATPLMLLCIGYGINLSLNSLKISAKVMIVRLAVTIVVGTLFKVLIIDNIIETTMLFNVSYISFLILPPMFSLPILISENGNKNDYEIASSAVGIYTVISILVFIAFAFLVPVDML
ncbi:MAG: hypothetical protein BEN19_00510 [Epulopiscium sp. Nuni2H_MBin003]|nr:MAG: hypothetical protein BEN19_00510 [Epulopiscium sp. Nuni2H_MBin003]